MSNIPNWFITIITTVIVVLIGKIFLSRKESSELSQKKYENTIAATSQFDQAYKEYTNVLNSYSNIEAPSQDDFTQIAIKGDLYFSQIAKMCDAIIAGKANESIRDATWLPKIKEAVERLLPFHYETLQTQAKKNGFEYQGELRRSDYESIYVVAERFSTKAAWQRPHERE